MPLEKQLLLTLELLDPFRYKLFRSRISCIGFVVIL